MGVNWWLLRDAVAERFAVVFFRAGADLELEADLTFEADLGVEPEAGDFETPERGADLTDVPPAALLVIVFFEVPLG